MLLKQLKLNKLFSRKNFSIPPSNNKKKTSNQVFHKNNNTSSNTNQEDLLSKMKNPKTEGGRMIKSIAIGLGICSIGLIASIIGLR